jgi:hypothetical protein
MTMNLRLMGLLAVLPLSACQCGAPPSGECTGTWGGQTFDKAQLDLTSKVVIVNKKTCAETTEIKRYDISWGDAKVALKLTYNSGGPSILVGKTYTLPPAAGHFLTFAVTPNPPEPTGALTLGIQGIQGRRTGTLDLSSGTESLKCTFDVHYETEGARISCGGSGDADSD